MTGLFSSMGIKHPKNFILPVLLVFLLAGVWDEVSIAGEGGLFEQQKLASHLLVNAFLEKVDHDELSIFDQQIKREDLAPHHVAFVHNMADDVLKAELCFMLTKYISVPDFEDFYVEKITVDMDKDGNIIQISTHVSPTEQVLEKGVEQDPAIQ